MDGGDGSYVVAVVGAPGPTVTSNYVYTSTTIRCDSQYIATVEIDYNIAFDSTAVGTFCQGFWVVKRNGVNVIFQNKISPVGGTLIEAGTFSSAPLTLLANTNYVFLFQLQFEAAQPGALTNANGAIRFRPLTNP